MEENRLDQDVKIRYSTLDDHKKMMDSIYDEIDTAVGYANESDKKIKKMSAIFEGVSACLEKVYSVSYDTSTETLLINAGGENKKFVINISQVSGYLEVYCEAPFEFEDGALAILSLFVSHYNCYREMFELKFDALASGKIYFEEACGIDENFDIERFKLLVETIEKQMIDLYDLLKSIAEGRIPEEVKIYYSGLLSSGLYYLNRNEIKKNSSNIQTIYKIHDYHVNFVFDKWGMIE